MSEAPPAPEPRGVARAEPAAVFSALGDATRLAVLGALSQGEPQSIARLTDGTGMTRQAVTKHLRVLESAGIVTHVRVGRESRYALQPEALREAQAWLGTLSRQWDAALGRLADFLDR